MPSIYRESVAVLEYGGTHKREMPENSGFVDSQGTVGRPCSIRVTVAGPTKKLLVLEICMNIDWSLLGLAA